MARRLVEAGTRFVTVHYDCVDGYSWDSHRNSDDVKNHLLPTFDQGCSALLTDLDERGLLDETLVVAIGEMGRTPKANATWGRNHWSTCFPALLAGAGIRGGAVYGKSDKHAAYPEENPVSPFPRIWPRRSTGRSASIRICFCRIARVGRFRSLKAVSRKRSFLGKAQWNLGKGVDACGAYPNISVRGRSLSANESTGQPTCLSMLTVG